MYHSWNHCTITREMWKAKCVDMFKVEGRPDPSWFWLIANESPTWACVNMLREKKWEQVCGPGKCVCVFVFMWVGV